MQKRMNKDQPVRQILQDILSHHKFEELEPFKNNKSWAGMDESERQLLASLFVLQGEKQLSQGDQNAPKTFDLAVNVAPQDSDILYRIGTAYAVANTSLPCLKNAENAMRQALKLQPSHFNATLALGNIYSAIGMLMHESESFNQANEYFAKAEQIASENQLLNAPHLYSHWGVCYYFQGKHSGEAVDFHKALEKFRTAADAGLQDKFFWNAYGDTLAELACLLDKEELFYTVVELYRNAVRQAFDYFDGWLSLGCAFQRLYDFYGNEDHFHQAAECFKMASQLNESNSVLWLKWAQLLAAAGKNKHDSKLISTAFEKFIKADACEPNSALILGLWGEALLLYGAQSENVELLREAQQKTFRSLELNPDSAEIWYIHGCSFYELGRYFNQEEYYHQAIDKFQFGLSIKQSEPLLWYGLAIAYNAIGDMRSDAKWLEKASQLFSRVIEFKGHGYRPMWNDWGVTLMRLAEITDEKSYIEQAIDKFEQVIPCDADRWDDEGINLEWLYNYGCALDFYGDFTEETVHYEKAILALSKVLHGDPKYTNARYNLALTYAHLGDLARDVECFHKSIEQFQILLSQDSEDEMGWCYYGVTIIHLAQLIQDPIHPEQSQKLYEIAENKLMSALALGSTQAFYNLACLNSLQGNHQASLHYLERAEAARALPPVDQILYDEWLDNVRSTHSFRSFVNQLSAKHYPENLSN